MTVPLATTRTTLRAEDLRNLLEHAPGSWQEIAGYLGLGSAADVRGMVERGELTREQLPLRIQIGLLAGDFDAKSAAEDLEADRTGDMGCRASGRAWEAAAAHLRALAGLE